jgi:cell division protein FtsZ
MGLFEVNEAAEIIGSAADSDANIIFGAVIDEQLGDQVRVTVIATGFDRNSPDRPAAAFAAGGRRDQQPRRPEPPADSRDTGQFQMPPDALEIPSFLRDE